MLIDEAILNYRNDPTEENRQTLMQIQVERNEAFYRSQADEYIERTK